MTKKQFDRVYNRIEEAFGYAYAHNPMDWKEQMAWLTDMWVGNELVPREAAMAAFEELDIILDTLDFDLTMLLSNNFNVHVAAWPEWEEQKELLRDILWWYHQRGTGESVR